VTGEWGTGDLEHIVARVSRRLMPLLFLIYVVNFLDRINVSFAALQMNRDLGFSASVYGFGAGIFFLGYVTFGIPANALLLRIGVRRWMGGIMVVWGLISAATALVHTPAQFYLVRTLLGFAEAGFFPGIIYYLGRWFPLEARARAVSRFMVAVPVAGLVGGPISGAILGLDATGGIAGWRWLFVLEALPAIVLGLAALRLLLEGPADAAWLSVDERERLTAALEAEHRAAPATGPARLLQALGHPAIWAIALCWFCLVLVGYGWTLWLPQVLKERSGESNLAVGFLSSLPNIAGIAGALLIAASSDRSGERRLHVVLPAALIIFGLCGVAATRSVSLTVAGFALVSASQCGVWGPFWTMPGDYLRGAALAAAVALINSVGNIGGFAGPYLMGLLRDRTANYSQGLLALAAIQAVGVALAFALWWYRPRRAA